MTDVYCRPMEIGTPEEMSVYDVKDHMEYKFRPGYVVVRIGGYDIEVSGVSNDKVYRIAYSKQYSR